MRVYIASSFELTDTVDVVARYLEARGHTIAVKWWAADGFNMHDKKVSTVKSEDFYADPVCRAIYERDKAGVLMADAFVLVTDMTTPKAYNGANIEYGMALAVGKPCFSLGTLARCALYYPIVQCSALSELAEKIEGRPKCPECGTKMRTPNYMHERNWCPKCGYEEKVKPDEK